MLTETIPGISRVGVLYGRSSIQTGPRAFQDYEAPARALKIALQVLEVRPPNPDLVGAFRDAAKGRAQALIAVTTSVLVPNDKKIADLAIKHRLPSMFVAGHYVEAGGLMSYSADDRESFKRAAIYVDKILKGAKPADLPVEQPTKFELMINLKAAKQIGLTIPPNVLARADKVIKIGESCECKDQRKSRVLNLVMRSCAMLFALCSAEAQQPEKVPRIGYLSLRSSY